MRKIDPVLYQQLKNLIETMGYELVGAEIVSSQGCKIFRLYIDKHQGVTVGDCSNVSSQVSALLDVIDPIQSRYNLEVSSPGIDRPLFEINDYQKFIGRLVKIRLHVAVASRRQYKGRLQRVEGENIYLLVTESEQEVVLPFPLIEKGNLIDELHLTKRNHVG